jgi:hypothetical protein
MDDPILTPRGAGGYLTATDVADLKLGITDGDARLFIASTASCRFNAEATQIRSTTAIGASCLRR